MKNLTRLFYLSLVISSLASCTTERTSSVRDDFKEYGSSRINLIETTIISGHRLSIVEVDGKEFFVNSEGGIQPLTNQLQNENP